jgi:hypothetical protein
VGQLAAHGPRVEALGVAPHQLVERAADVDLQEGADLPAGLVARAAGVAPTETRAAGVLTSARRAMSASLLK